MSEKANIQNIIKEWKKQNSESEKKLFLESLESKIDAQTPAESLAQIKAIHKQVESLHKEVVLTDINRSLEPIIITPSSKEEANFIKNLLQRMNIMFKSAG